MGGRVSGEGVVGREGKWGGRVVWRRVSGGWEGGRWGKWGMVVGRVSGVRRVVGREGRREGGRVSGGRRVSGGGR